ncbi:hypothetical protein WDU94_009529 [Cyamophila willieti]
MSMFSGLSKEVSNWLPVGKKNDDEEEEVPSPKLGNEAATLPDEKASDPKGSRLEMLGNVKSQMTSWLGSASIPGLGKKDENVPENAEKLDDSSPVSEKSIKGSPTEKDDDNSSATGGADSDIHASEGELDGEDGGIGGVSTKAIQGAKNIKSFLFSAVNKAGKTVSEAGAKIKKTVEENDILGNFNKEGEGGKDKAKPGEAVPPWVGHPNQESLKEECLSLSKDRRNFVRSPPPGVDFDFDYEAQYPVAQAVLAEDPLLEKMKEELVPKLLSEETFWRNYFYRVSLICQANEMEQESSETRNSTEPDSTA